MARMLVIEDNRDLNELLVEALRERGHDVDSAYDGVTGTRMAPNGYDLLLVDIMLPYLSGEAILRRVREAGDTPVIMISAKDAVWTKVDLLEMGADDYITKPFDLNEVTARIGTVLRRTLTAPSDQHRVRRYKDLVLDVDQKHVTVGGEEITLTPTESSILELLIDSPGRVWSKGSIYEAVWGIPMTVDDNAVKAHVSNLRAKLRSKSPSHTYIETLWGFGYRMPHS